MDKPLVSVIMIFLNEERFIREAIESVFPQNYKNWELMLVDDGSTDRSTGIARRYAEQHPGKVRYLEHDGHENRGMSASRNLGIRHAKGAYIALLDADDVWFLHTLEEQVAILESHSEAAMVYGSIQRWYSWAGNPEDLQRDSLRDLVVQPDTLLEPPTLFLLLLQDIGVPSGILARREVIERVGGFEPAFRGMYEDNAFLAKIGLREPVFASSKCWYRYRKHPDSACAVAVKTGQYHPARLTFLHWVEEYLSKEKIQDNEVWQALRKELRPYRHPILSHLFGRTRHLVWRTTGLLKQQQRGIVCDR